MTDLFRRFDETEMEFDAHGIEYDPIDENGILTLKIVPDNIADASSVIMEISFIKAPAGTLIQFFTTIAQKLLPERYPAILEELNRVNMHTFIGAYGILPEQGLLFHKYQIVEAGSGECEAVRYAGLVLEQIDGDFKRLFSVLD